jgi:dCTP deaminase
MILSGPEILKQIEAGNIAIDPFDLKRINPASVDLTLGDLVSVYSDNLDWSPGQTVGSPPIASNGLDLDPAPPRTLIRSVPLELDSKVEPKVLRYRIDPQEGWVLKPGIGYLMHTAERVSAKCFVPILDGKSSIGRLFIKIHETAGFGDPGFDGQYTLEVTSQFPVRVYPGMRFCQIRFHAIQGEVLSYKEAGNYVGERASGPVPSRAFWSAFK